MRDLICEGVCNPLLPQFDDAAERWHEVRLLAVKGYGVPPSELGTCLDRVIGLRRQLRHTPHQHAAGNRWACGVCGCERRYGAPLDVPSEFMGSWGRQTAAQRARRRTA